MTIGKELYGPKLIELPAPRFVVFYNGTKKQPERKTLRLSDAYMKKQEQPELELTVTVYNINWGHNPQLLEACQLLKEYAQFVNQVRVYMYEEGLSVAEAAEKAIVYCIGHDILRDFLLKNRMEATEVCIFEYNEKEHMENEREYGRKEGETLLSTLMQHLFADGRIEDAKLAAEDEGARHTFYKEYGLTHQ